MHLTPAYGRQYDSRAQVLAAFDANRDFIISEGPYRTYINKEQVPAGTQVQFRFGKDLRKTFSRKIK